MTMTSIWPTACRIPMSEDSLVYGTARLAECARISVKLGDQSITTHNGLPGKDNVSRVVSSVSLGHSSGFEIVLHCVILPPFTPCDLVSR